MLAKNETTPIQNNPGSREVGVAAEGAICLNAEKAHQCLKLTEFFHRPADGGLRQIQLSGGSPQGGVGASLPAGFHIDIQSCNKSGMGHIEGQQFPGQQGITAGELGPFDLICVPGVDRTGESMTVAEAADLMDQTPLLKLLQRLLHRSRTAVGQCCQLFNRLPDGAVPAAVGKQRKEHALGAGVQLGVRDDIVGHRGIALLPHFSLSFRKNVYLKGKKSPSVAKREK